MNQNRDVRMQAGPGPLQTAPADRSPKTLYVAGVALVAIAIMIVIALSAFKHASLKHEQHELTAAVEAGPHVQVAVVHRSGGQHTVTLTGEARPFLSTTVFSKVSGYLKSVMVDKGDHVSEGQVLAVVESPETDQEYTAAVADARNKRAIADSDRQLVSKKLIAAEEAATDEAQAQVAEARAARASTFKAYETLRAPFAGTVTARYADPGALVQDAENAQTSALPVVAVGTTDSLRIYVYVDQRDAGAVQRGTPVTLVDPANPGNVVNASVTRYTGELDPNTRTLLAEIDLSNRHHQIVAGGFIQVSLDVKGSAYYELPASALISRGTKQFVAVVDAQNHVHFRPVTVVDTDGDNVLLLDGVQDGDRVALDLGNSVAEGQHVQPVGDTPVRQTT